MGSLLWRRTTHPQCSQAGLLILASLAARDRKLAPTGCLVYFSSLMPMADLRASDSGFLEAHHIKLSLCITFKASTPGNYAS